MLFDILTKAENKKEMLSLLMVGVQKSSNDRMVKKTLTGKFAGLELYIYFAINEKLNMIVSEDVFAEMEINIEDAWKIAFENLHKSVTITSVTNALKECGMLDDSCEDDLGMYVVSTERMEKGAAAVFDRKVKEFIKEKGYKKVAILPSSIHEMLLLPIDNSFNENELSMMVKTINSTEVEPSDQLIDKAIIISSDEL